jgi:predicted transcriptional regulator of viral defense system
MRFGDLLEAVGDEPVFETGLLLAGDVDPADVRRQLSRWVKAGWLHQLRRGLYVLAPPHQKVRPHPFLVANRLVRGSYVSLHSALAYHGLIPEYVPVTTSVTTGRAGRRETPLGAFEYHHIHPELFTGYRLEALGEGQQAFVATGAKALTDLVHLTPGADAPAYLEGLRLQNVEALDVEARWLATRPKLRRALRRVGDLARAEP